MTFSNDIEYIIAYCIFLIGAALSFQKNAPRSALIIMSAGIALDFLASVMPVMKVKSLAIDIPSNPAIVGGIFSGIFVWVLFLASIFLWTIKKIPLFHLLIIVIEVLWFCSLMLFLYGIYKVPLS
jgi:hypothetical protein